MAQDFNLRRGRQISEVKDSIDYRVSSRSARAVTEKSCLEKYKMMMMITQNMQISKKPKVRTLRVAIQSTKNGSSPLKLRTAKAKSHN